MSIAVFPGSFDPITRGHLDIVRRASGMFDRTIVGVATNAGKSPLLTAHQRVELARLAVGDLRGVEVDVVPGLLVEYCRTRAVTAIIKGLRSGSDLDDELPMAAMNRHLTGIETVFLPADGALQHVASSLVKDVARHGGQIADLVSAEVADAVYAALGTTPPRGTSHETALRDSVSDEAPQ